jgi:hypothetical protein
MPSTINRNEWIFEQCGKSIINNKERLRQSVITQMLNKTTKMFKYRDLPDTIYYKDLETILQVGGFGIWKEVKGKLYVFKGSLGGVPNPYYLPTQAIIANPALKYNASLEIDKECVVMLNDHYYQGMMPLFDKYGSLLVEAELSLKYAIYNARIPALIEAGNTNSYESAVSFLNKIIEGQEYGVIAGAELLEGIKTQSFYQQNYIKEIIEAIQYIKGSWYNEIGINAAFNMKREAINEAEALINEDILYPTVDVMLECRNIGLEKVNKMFNTNISVELDSIWDKNRVDDELAQAFEEAKIEDLEGNNDEKISGNTNESRDN